MRASRFSSRRGGTVWSSRRTTADRCTSRRRLDWPGNEQRRRADHPDEDERRSPRRAGGRRTSRGTRSGVSRRPPRTNEPAMPASVWRSTAPSDRADEPRDRRLGRAGAAVEQVRRDARAAVSRRRRARRARAQSRRDRGASRRARVSGDEASAIQSTTLAHRASLADGLDGPGYNAPSRGRSSVG